ncbi:hypothetical protein GMES_0276 [Paraglaciecola mesophila KMM 241]|uniref:Uncharacterized protein n=1 Tax=Paraglaciecola mesophila KMM 241 TaxID=1128912 RepID=K6ZGS3_9ALTE|nr:hypothetical protein GMES_0276 [Paraglaciecola mesophila KMM 241]
MSQRVIAGLDEWLPTTEPGLSTNSTFIFVSEALATLIIHLSV